MGRPVGVEKSVRFGSDGRGKLFGFEGLCGCVPRKARMRMSSKRNIGLRLAGVLVGAALLVLGLAAPAFAAVPTIISFAPTSGPVGTSVTITGTGFTVPDITKVTFGANTATPVDQTTVIVDSSTQVRAAVPTGALTGKLTVTNTDGTSAQSSGTFTVTAASVPTITSFAPTSGPVGTSVTITGTNLSGATSVKFNGVSATIGSNTATQIVTTVPTGATTGKITVTTPGGTATSTTDFTVTGTTQTHARSLSLRLKDSLVARGRVRVSDGFAACADSVPVKIQKKVSGHWKTVKNTTTSSTGAYRIHLRNKHGRYRSLAPRVTMSTDTCSKARSSTQRH
jgi:IPT/TIG domain